MTLRIVYSAECVVCQGALDRTASDWIIVAICLPSGPFLRVVDLHLLLTFSFAV
jgi:hypothetical protein